MKTRTIHVQPRDIRFLSDFGKVLVMDDELLQEEYFPRDLTGDSRARRMRMLRSDGRVSRMRVAEVSLTDDPPRLHTFYRLTPRGADLLAELGMPPKRLLRKDPRPETLLHRGDSARVIVRMDKAALAAGLPSPEWILESDLRPGTARQPKLPRAERFILYEDFKTSGQILKLRPDASSWLRFPHHGTWFDLLIWWEIDRATEGLPQITDKLPPYDFLFRQEERGGMRVYRRHWPTVEQATLRLFFVCPSLQRIRSISSALKDVPGGQFVRLATLDSLKSDDEMRPEYHGQPLCSQKALRAKIWYDVLGAAHAIYPYRPGDK